MLPPSQRSDIDDVDVISRVAAEATRGEPSPAFRARVMARIEARRPSYATWVFSVAAAAAAVIAILVVHPWQRQPTPINATVAVTNLPIEPVAPSPAAPSPSPNEPVATESRVNRAAAAHIFTPDVPGLPPIDPIEPITRDSIQPTTLSIPQLTLKPLVMPAVDDDGSIRDRR